MVLLARWLREKKGDACVPSLLPRGSAGFSQGGWEDVTSYLFIRQSGSQP